jgi:uncharacterized protein YegL
MTDTNTGADAHIVLLLDRSYSMRRHTEDVAAGVNLFLDEQSRLPGRARVTFVQFSSRYQIMYDDLDLAAAPRLRPEEFVTDGFTALYDALGKTIDHTAARLAEQKSTAPVIVVVITDGCDTASDAETPARIKARIAKHPSWRFLFLGANFDAVLEGKNLGVSGMSYRTENEGLVQAAQTASAFAGASRAGDDAMLDRLARAPDVDDAAEIVLDFQRKLSERKVGTGEGAN